MHVFYMQGKKENEYLAFTSRSKENKKYYSYLFMAKNSKMVGIVHACVCLSFDCVDVGYQGLGVLQVSICACPLHDAPSSSV